MEIKVATSDLTSVAQAAHELGRHRATIYRWADTGKIIGIKLAGILFIPKSEIERLKSEEALKEATLDQVESLKNEKNNQATERPVA